MISYELNISTGHIPGKCKYLFIQPALIVLFLMGSISNYAQAPKQAVANTGKSNTNITGKITWQVIPAESNTYGYDIYMDGSLIIHQPSRPAMPGNTGFDTKEKAAAVAKMVIDKIKKGEMPPTISVEELKKVKAI